MVILYGRHSIFYVPSPGFRYGQAIRQDPRISDNGDRGGRTNQNMGTQTQEKTQWSMPKAKPIMCGIVSLSMMAGLTALPYGTSQALAIEGDPIIESTEEATISEAEAVMRAEEARTTEVPSDEIVPGQIIVELLPETNDLAVLSATLEGTGMHVEERLLGSDDNLGAVYLVSVPASMELSEAKAICLENTQVAGAYYNVMLQADGDEEETQAENQSTEPLDAEAVTANDTDIARQWEAAPEFLDYEGAWQTASEAGWTDSSDVTVAILDTGIESHPDLDENVVTTHNATSEPTMADDHPTGHGTSVAGVVSARTNNSKGICSLSYNANILPIKVFSHDTNNNYVANVDDVIKAIGWLTTENASLDGETPAKHYNVKVANLSVGNPSTKTSQDVKDAFDNAMQRLWNNDIILVNSMGNVISGMSLPYKHWPTQDGNGRCVGVISLQKSASGTGVVLADHSNYNLSETDIAAGVSAPGQAIYTTSSSGGYVSFSGTSAATPHVSSLLALMFAVNPDMSLTQAITCLYEHTKPVGAKTTSEPQNTPKYVGNGMIDPEGAVEAAIALRQTAFADPSELDGMQAYIDGTAVDGWSTSKTNYPNAHDFGIVTSTPNTAVTFTSEPVATMWTKTTSFSQSDQVTTDEEGRSIKTYTKVVTVTFKSTRNASNGEPISIPYVFTIKWSMVSEDPNAALIDQLDGMTVSTSDGNLSDFDYKNLSYSKDYETIETTKQLPSSLTITLPSGASWTSSPSPSNPIIDKDEKQIDSDGVTRGTRTKKLEYVLQSTTNGSGGAPLSRTYSFTFTGAYVDNSTRYKTVLKDIKLNIGDTEYSGFNSETSSYSIEKEMSEMASIPAPKFTNLPQGWTQQTSEPKVEESDTSNGNGTNTKKTTKTYTITLSNGQGGQVKYTVSFYAESIYESPDTEDNPSGGNGSDNQGGSGNQGGSSNQGGSGNQGGSSNQGGSDNQGGSGNQGESSNQSNGQSGTTGQQTSNGNQTSNPSSQSSGTSSASNGTTGTQQRKTTGSNSDILRTGDATIIIVGTIIAAAVAVAIWMQARKNN